MKVPVEVLDIFKDYNKLIDDRIKLAITNQKTGNDYDKMFNMMSYYFGYLDENFKEVDIYGGKKFRSGICLLISDFYNSRDAALKFATAIEIFHNFTLIHDDIEDNDLLRRGRPSIWSVWGLNHGINTGDAQLMIALKVLTQGADDNDGKGIAAEKFLLDRFIEIAEGQYLDFMLTDTKIGDAKVNEETYLEMVTKKTSILIGAAAKSAGMISGVDKEEQEALWEYGVNLGIAYQICDDLVSIWGNSEITGKVAANDIREKKKTLPIIHLFDNIENDKLQKLTKIYNKKEDLSESEISLFIKELDEVKSYNYTWNKLEEYKNKSIQSVSKLSISDENKELLVKIVYALLPNVKEICKC